MGAAGAVSGGSKGGGGTSGGGYSSIVDSTAAAAAISAQYGKQAQDALAKYYQQAQQSYGNYYNQATQQLQTSNAQSQALLQGGVRQGNQALLDSQSQAGTYLAPYLGAGMNALDAYQQSMGIGTPVGGSLAAFNQQQAAATAQQNLNMAAGDKYNTDLLAYNNSQNEFQNKLNALNGGPGGPVTGGGAQGSGYVYDPATGIATRAATGAQGLSQLDDAVRAAMNQITAWNVNGNPADINQMGVSVLKPGATATQKLAALKAYQGVFGNLDVGKTSPLLGQMASAIAGYKAPTEAATQNIGMSPTAPNQAQYLAAQTPIAAAPEMMSNSAAAQQGLQNFYSSPEYQALYGGSPAEMTQQGIEQRFKNDPGYQFQLQQGLQATQNNAIAKGQGYSPAMQQALMGYGTGLASQSFDTYRTGLSNTFNQYQNQLQNLSQMGQQAAGGGATMAQQVGQGINQNITGLATGQANLNAATGQQLANNSMNAAGATSGMAMNQGQSLSNNLMTQGDTQANAALAAGQARAMQSQYQSASSSSAAGGLLGGLGGGLSAWMGTGQKDALGMPGLGSLFGGTSGGGGGVSGYTGQALPQGQGAGLMSGAASGAAAGSMFGPWGTAIGGAAGALSSFFK